MTQAPRRHGTGRGDPGRERPAGRARAGPGARRSRRPRAPADNVEQQNDSTSIPQRPAHKQIVRPAGQDEDDEISVQEEPPDLAAGEQPIPPGGVPDAIADAALPEAPAAAADEAELAAEEDAGRPKQEASASARPPISRAPRRQTPPPRPLPERAHDLRVTFPRGACLTS